MRGPYHLPSVRDLQCFEAVARHLSFTKAAAEFNVTLGAISHRINALEAELGQKLFVRTGRGISLSATGAALLGSVQSGLEAMAVGVKAVRGVSNRKEVSISATTAVSGLWLAPKLPGFFQKHPDISVVQVVQDSQTGFTDVDLSVTYGDPGGDATQTVELFRDRIFAVGSEELHRRFNISRIEDLLSIPLLQVEIDWETPTAWPEWSEWLRFHGLSDIKDVQYKVNNYLVALRASEDGIGAILGWDILHGLFTGARKLKKLVPQSLEAPHPYFLRINSGASENARIFAAWLTEQARMEQEACRAEPAHVV